MSKFVKSIGMAALVTVVTVLALSVAAYVQPATAAQPTTTAFHGARGLCGQAGQEAAAKALGLTTDELSTQLWGGESLSSLADKAGVELQAVQDAVTAACQQANREAIEQAVTDGTLTRDHADWLLEGLEKGYWGGSGGFGLGPRGFGGDGRFGHGRPPLNNTIVPTNTPGNGA